MLSSCLLLKSLPLAKSTQDAAMRDIFCLSTLPPQCHQLFFQGGQLSNPLGHVFDVLIQHVVHGLTTLVGGCLERQQSPNFIQGHVQ